MQFLRLHRDFYEWRVTPPAPPLYIFPPARAPPFVFLLNVPQPRIYPRIYLRDRRLDIYIYLFIRLLDTPLLFPNRTKSQSAAVRSIRSNNAIDGWKKDLFLHKFITNNYGLFPIDRHSILRGLTWKNLGRLNPALFIAREYVYRRLER